MIVLTKIPFWWPSDKPWMIDDYKNIVKDIPDKSIDLILTDPPYGVGLDYGETYEDSEENWYGLMSEFLPEAKRISNMIIMPCCRIKDLDWFYENFPPQWLISWYKGSPGHVSYIGFNDWEPLLVYGKNEGIQMHDHFYCQPNTDPNNNHPCPKPVGWAEWLIKRATEKRDIVFDPFLGSGTTLKACRNTDRIGLGCEINPEYESIIEKRSLNNVKRIDDYD